jgi:hypothetical protein
VWIATQSLRSAASESNKSECDIPITAIITMETEGTGTRYVFTALHRDEADLEKNTASGFYEGTEIAVEQFVEHVMAMK